MAKHAATKFKRRLTELFRHRTFWLREAIVGGTTRPPKLDRARIDREIGKLKELASDALASDLATEEFEKNVKKRKSWKVSGYGWRKKRDGFDTWYNKVIPHADCLYVFWGKNGKCIYAGRTINGNGRPRAHFDKVWFGSTKKVTIYSTSTRSHVPKLECLAWHAYKPVENEIKPSIPKWSKKCPVCEVHKLVERELRTIFRLKG